MPEVQFEADIPIEGGTVASIPAGHLFMMEQRPNVVLLKCSNDAAVIFESGHPPEVLPTDRNGKVQAVDLGVPRIFYEPRHS